MAELKLDIDYYAVGLKENWVDIIIGLADIQLLFNKKPRLEFIMRHIRDGYTYDEIATLLKVCTKTIQRDLKIVNS